MKDARFTSVLEKSDNKVWGAHFRVPKRVADGMAQGTSRRVVCTLNGAPEFQCAILPRGNGSFVITVNKQLRNALSLAFGSDLKIRLRKDTSAYGLPFPPELRELLRQDPAGNRLFHALTPGRRRTLLYIIGKTQDSGRRTDRSIIVITHLKSNAGKINYRQLNAALKDPRGTITR